jgi:hypothetical protein
VAGDGDRVRQNGGRAQKFDVEADGLLGVGDGFPGQGRVVAADEVSEAPAERPLF